MNARRSLLPPPGPCDIRRLANVFRQLFVDFFSTVVFLAVYVPVIAVGAKILAFAIQYAVFRIITRKLRAAAA